MEAKVPLWMAMTPQGLSLTLWAVARLGYVPRAAVLDRLTAACLADMQPHVGSSSGSFWRGARTGASACALDVAQRVWALATLGVHPGAAWVDAATDAFLQAEAEAEAAAVAAAAQRQVRRKSNHEPRGCCGLWIAPGPA